MPKTWKSTVATLNFTDEKQNTYHQTISHLTKDAAEDDIAKLGQALASLTDNLKYIGATTTEKDNLA